MDMSPAFRAYPTSTTCDTTGRGALALYGFLPVAQKRELIIDRGHTKNQDQLYGSPKNKRHRIGREVEERLNCN